MSGSTLTTTSYKLTTKTMRGRGIVKLHSAICTKACKLSPSSLPQHQRRFISHQDSSQDNRTTAIQTFFQQIESKYGNLSSLIDKGPASETIVSTDGLLHPQHLIRLFRHEATALHVPNFYNSTSAVRLGSELIRESQQSGKNNNWKVSTSRGLESSDVGTLGEHCPYNVAVARDAQQQKQQQQQSTRNDYGGEESNIKSPIDEYFEGVQREFHSRRRRRSISSNPATNGSDDCSSSDYYQLWPLDKLRLELEESWPSGAGLARETTTTQTQSSKSQQRVFGGGLPRIMTGPTRWKRGFIHVDELGPLNHEKGLFSANIYLKMPDETTANNGEDENETVGGGGKSDWKRDAGALYVWPLGVRSRLDWYRNAMTLSSLSAQDPEMQMKLRHVLGEPNVIRPKPGDLVLLCTQRTPFASHMNISLHRNENKASPAWHKIIMDPNTLAADYACKVCGVLPTDPYFAEDGHCYHEACIRTVFDCSEPGMVISPATHEPMGRHLIFAKGVQCFIEKLLATKEVNGTLIGEENQDEEDEEIKVTLQLAHEESPEHMALLGRWYLLGEQEGIEPDEEKCYRWCEKAADLGNADGMAYQGVCLVHGYGVEKDRNEGFELLIDAANDGSGKTFDLVLFIVSHHNLACVGSFYFSGLHGFKEDRKKALKWLSKADDAAVNPDNNLMKDEKENIRKYMNDISPGASKQIASDSGSASPVGGMISSTTVLSNSSSGTGSSMSSVSSSSAGVRPPPRTSGGTDSSLTRLESVPEQDIPEQIRRSGDVHEHSHDHESDVSSVGMCSATDQAARRQAFNSPAAAAGYEYRLPRESAQHRPSEEQSTVERDGNIITEALERACLDGSKQI